MKKIKSKFLLGLSLLFATVCLSGCGDSGAQPNFEVPDAGYDGSAVTIKFYHTMGESLRAVLDTYIAEFNETYPNITVEHSQVGSYDDVRDQIKTEISIGEQPNIAYCYPDHVALYNKAKAVVSLDNLIDDATLGLTQAQKDDFIEGYYNEGKQFGDGLMYSMPFSKSTEVLYYNKTFFDANNLAVPTTWDEMETVCKAIKEIDPNSIPLGYDSEANWFITMCEQYKSAYTSATAPHFLFDNTTNRTFVEKFADWYQKGYVTTQAIYGAYTSGLFTSTEDIKSYMSIGSSAGASYQCPSATSTRQFDCGIAPIPQVDATNNPKVISQGPSVCVFKSDNPQEVVASWLLVKFLTTSVGFQAQFGIASGYVPVLKSVATNATYKAFMDGAGYTRTTITALSAKVCLEQEEYYYTSPAFIGSSTARDEVGSLMISVLSGAKTADAAFADALAECEYQAGSK